MTKTLFLGAAAACLVLSGCGVKKESPEFEKKFAKAKRESGLKQVQVIDTSKARNLKGNVQRLGRPVPPPGAVTRARVYRKLTQNMVGKLIRRQLSRLYECQQLTKGRAGKALLTIKIAPSGRVTASSVNAPSFKGTRLPNCLRDAAKTWIFPRFKSGTVEYTYPFIFR